MDEPDYDEDDLEYTPAAAPAAAAAGDEDLDALLYGDLGEAAPITAQEESYEDLQAELLLLRQTVAELTGKNKALTEENERLTKQSTALKRNISCLFKTARAELDRKNAVMKALEDQNHWLTLHPFSTLPPPLPLLPPQATTQDITASPAVTDGVPLASADANHRLPPVPFVHPARLPLLVPQAAPAEPDAMPQRPATAAFVRPSRVANHVPAAVSDPSLRREDADTRSERAESESDPRHSRYRDSDSGAARRDDARRDGRPDPHSSRDFIHQARRTQSRDDNPPKRPPPSTFFA